MEKGVLDHVDPGKNVRKHKRSYLASPLNVASFLFLKRGLCVPGLSGALGGHVLAKMLVEPWRSCGTDAASDREMVATVGHPGECWFPGDPPEEMNVSIVGGDATSERTKSMSGWTPSFLRSLAPSGRYQSRQIVRSLATPCQRWRYPTLPTPVGRSGGRVVLEGEANPEVALSGEAGQAPPQAELLPQCPCGAEVDRHATSSARSASTPC